MINIEIRKMIINIFIRGLRSNIYYFDKFVIFTFYIKKVFFEDKRVFAEIIKKIHIVNNFKIEIFVETDIFISKRINIDFIN